MPQEEIFIYTGMVNHIDNFYIAFAFYDEASHTIGLMIVEEKQKTGHRVFMFSEGDSLPFNPKKQIHEIISPVNYSTDEVIPVVLVKSL